MVVVFEMNTEKFVHIHTHTMEDKLIKDNTVSVITVRGSFQGIDHSTGTIHCAPE